MDDHEKHRFKRMEETRTMNTFERARDKFERNRLSQERPMPKQVEDVPTPKPKAKGCLVGIIVVDDGGEHVFMWNAPSLKGTMMPTKQNLQGYKEAVFEAFQKAFGKLTENR